jgi:hypothetical protein
VYGRESLLLTLREHKLRVFKDRVLKRMLELMKEEVKETAIKSTVMMFYNL